MLFKVIDKANWKENEWDELFSLVNDFKKEFNLKLVSIDKLLNGKYCFSLEGYYIHFERNSQGSWVTFEANTSKTDFDEKFNFISERI